MEMVFNNLFRDNNGFPESSAGETTEMDPTRKFLRN